MLSPVEEIKSRLDIVDLINESVALKQAGQNWRAPCPFHNEKTPSFMVSRDKGIWHCFGCGRGGDIFTFVQEIEGMDFPETLRLLAKRAGVQLKDHDPKLSTQRTKVIDLLRWVARYYHDVLLKSSQAEAARQYLVVRKVSAATIEEFQIGFAAGNGDVAYQALRQKGFNDDDIFQAGMTIKKDRGVGYYDRFRQRIMFPLADVHGTTVGFSGRILESALDPNKPTPAKYINSPQTLVYNKSLVLFGLDKARQAIKQANRAVLVEGQMDCIASHQAGVRNVVASSGTALTLDQVQLLKRFTPNLVLALDQDAAGFQATVRGVEHALKEAMDIKIVRLPFGKDPDELIGQDPKAWEDVTQQAEPLMEYFFRQALQDKDVTKIDDKKAVARTLLPLLAKISDPIEQTHYLQQLADVIRVQVDDVRKSLPVARPEPVSPQPVARPERASPPPDRYRAVSERLLALLVRHPSFLSRVVSQLDPDLLIGPDLQTLYKTLVVWYTQNSLEDRQQMESLASALDGEQQHLIVLLSLLGDNEFSGVSDTVQGDELLTLVTTLKRHHISKRLEELERSMRQIEHQTGPKAAEQLTPLLEQFRDLTAQLRDLP